MLDRLVEKIRQSVLNSAQKDATRYDGTGDFLGVDNSGGDQLAAQHNGRSDDEVVHLNRRDTVARGDGTKKLACAVAIHRICSRLRSGYQRPCSCR